MSSTRTCTSRMRSSESLRKEVEARTKISSRLEAAAARRAAILQERKRIMCAKVTHAKLVAARRRQAPSEHPRQHHALVQPQQQQQSVEDGRGAHQHRLAQVHESAIVIQQWWRLNRHFDAATAAFKQAGLRIEAMQSASFDSATRRMRDDSLISGVAAMLDAVWSVSASGARRSWSARAFISAYLLTTHSEAIFSRGELAMEEDAVRDAAESMLAVFALLRAAVRRPRPRCALVQAFHAACTLYFICFDKWKAKDREYMLSRFEMRYAELEDFKGVVRNQDSERSAIPPAVYLDQVDKEQRRLVMQMARLGARERARDLVLRVSGPAQWAALTDCVGEKKQAEADTTKEDAQPPPIDMGNEALLHSLLVEPDFTLESDPAESPFVGAVRTQARKAFWDGLLASTMSGDYAMLMTLIQDIALQITSLAPNSAALRLRVDEGLDQDVILQQLRAGTFEARHYLLFVVEQLAGLCAPSRDDKVGDMRRRYEQLPPAPPPAEMVAAFEDVMEMLRLTRLDLANAHLNMARPLLLEQGVRYERDNFARRLESDGFSLGRTKEWVRQLPASDRFEHRLHAGLAAAFLPEEPLSLESIPETLHLDVERILRIGHHLWRLSVMAVLCMVARTSRVAPPSAAALHDACTGALGAWPDESADAAVALRALGERLEVGPDALHRFEVHAGKAVQYFSPVMVLVRSNLRSVVVDAMQGRAPAEQTYARMGLVPIKGELEGAVRRIAHFARHHVNVHLPTYQSVID